MLLLQPALDLRDTMCFFGGFFLLTVALASDLDPAHNTRYFKYTFLVHLGFSSTPSLLGHYK